MNSTPSAYLYLVTDIRRQNAVLTAVNIPNVGHCFTLLAGANMIGREAAPDVAIVLPSLPVSRRHARIDVSATAAWDIEDLQSRNGTEINGQKLQPRIPTPMNDGDRIRVAGVELIFTLQLDPTLVRDQPKVYPNPDDAELEEWLEGPYRRGANCLS